MRVTELACSELPPNFDVILALGVSVYGLALALIGFVAGWTLCRRAVLTIIRAERERG